MWQDKKTSKETVQKICKHYNVKLKKKSESLIMKIAGFIVSKILRTMSYKEFMNGFITTLFSTIYYTSEEYLSYEVLVHEITHVLQFRKFKIAKYLFPKGRAELELEAFSAEIEYFILSGKKISTFALDNLANTLYKYGLGDGEVSFVKKQLENVVKNAVKGNIKSNVARFVADLTSNQGE